MTPYLVVLSLSKTNKSLTSLTASVIAMAIKQGLEMPVFKCFGSTLLM